MFPDDDESEAVCAACGAALTLGAESAYVYGPSGMLCHTCAKERGGVYDATRDRWVVEPDLAGLADERRPRR